MKKFLRYLSLPFLYLYYFLHPINIISLIRNAYFSSMGMRLSGDNLRSSNGFMFSIVQLAVIVTALWGVTSILRPLIHLKFDVNSAVRVFFGFSGAYILYSICGHLQSRLRGQSSSPIDVSTIWVLAFLCVPAALVGALVAGATGDRFLGLLVAGAEMALIFTSLLPSPLAVRVTAGCLLAATVSVIGIALGEVHTPLSVWLPVLGHGLLAALILLFVLVGVFVVSSRVLQGRPAKLDYIVFAVMLLLTSAGLSLFLNQFGESVSIIRPSWLTIFLTYFLVVSRLPLWPFEALWARVRFPQLLARATQAHAHRGSYWSIGADAEQRTQPFRRAFRAAFFDRRSMLPFPGQLAALTALAKVDTQLACEEAIELLRFSPQLHLAKQALRQLAQENPIAAFSAISDLLRPESDHRYYAFQVASAIKGMSASLWQALTLMDEVARAAVALSKADPGPNAQPEPQQQFVGGVLDAFLVQARQKLASALELVVRVQVEPPSPPGANLLVSVLRQIVDEFNNDDAYSIKPLQIEPEWSREFSSKIYTEQYYEQAIARLENENWLAKSVNKIRAVTSLSRRRARMLKVVSEMNLFGPIGLLSLSLFTREKGPGLWILDLGLKVLSLRWRQLITLAAQQLADQEPVGPIESPFVLGQPVHGPLFMGRQRLMDELRSMWGDQQQWPSILLHGHRRMGKSSILHNIPELLRGRKVAVANLSMQELGQIQGAIEFLRPLARKIFRATKDIFEGLTESCLEPFEKYGPYEAFSEFIQLVEETRDGFRVLIAIDEYESIDELLKDGILENKLLTFLRSLLDSRCWITFVFAGLHTHKELDQEHWQLLFRTVLPVRVSFLSAADSQQLLAQPTADFPVDYDSVVLSQAAGLTAGQPFLLQLLGYSLLNRLNERRRHQANAPLLIGTEDLDAVLADPEFFQRGAPYFDGVMRQVRADQPASVQVLDALSASENGLSVAELQSATQLPAETFKAALALLLDHEVLRQDDWPGHVVFSVPLMRLERQRRQHR